MDPALLKEREAFRKRALAQPTVEKRKSKSKPEDVRPAKKHKHSSKPKPNYRPEPKPFDYKSAQSSASSQYKFGTLTKIVKYMKIRHQHGDTHPLSIEDILDETNLMDISSMNRHWLVTEALMNNPKIIVKNIDGESRYAFKPKYEVRDRKGLLNLLKNHDLHGYGGILLDDIEESVPNVEKVLKVLGDNVTYIIRPHDKKKVLFFNDKYCQCKVDDEVVKLWRAVSVEGCDEKKIQEYLEKQGITSMLDTGVRKVMPKQKRKKSKKLLKRDNVHLSGVLVDYSELTNKA